MLEKFKTVPVLTTILIMINVAIFVAFMLIQTPAMTQIYNDCVLSVPAIKAGRWWTLITSMFLHGGIVHILCNMVSLYYLGAMSESVFGKVKYLILYFASGIIGGIAFCAAQMAMGLSTGAVGASGAIFGLFGAYGYLLVRERKDNKIFVMKPGQADITSYITMLAINIFFGLTSSGIANEAHIGGLIAGFAISAIMYPMIIRRR